MLYNELPIPFSWYDKLEQQDRRREEVLDTQEYMLISPADALLPFQLTRVLTSDVVTGWNIINQCDDTIAVNLTPNINLIRKAVRDDKGYFTYPGGGIPNLLLPVGCYYSTMTFSNNKVMYSEVFKVPDNGRFLVTQGGETRFTRLQWWNDGDLQPIFYNDILNGKPSLINTVYLETYISGSDPEVTIDGDPDGQQETIRTFQKFSVPYKIVDLVTDSLKKALMLMQMHDHIVLTTPYGIRTGEINNVVVTATPEADYARSNIDITFHENVITKRNCPENMV